MLYGEYWSTLEEAGFDAMELCLEDVLGLHEADLVSSDPAGSRPFGSETVKLTDLDQTPKVRAWVIYKRALKC